MTTIRSWSPAFGGVVLGSLLAASTAVAAPITLMNDTFADGERSTQSLPGSAAWYFGSNGPAGSRQAVVVDQRLEMTGGHENNTSAVTTYFTMAGSPRALNATGDKLTLRFDFSFGMGDTYKHAEGFRLGLYHSGGARITTDLGTTNGADAAYNGWGGYSVFAPLNQTGSLQVLERAAVGSGSSSPITAASNTSKASAAVTTRLLPDTTFTGNTLTLTRTAGGVEVRANLQGVESVWVDTSPYTAFDAVHFWFAGSIAPSAAHPGMIDNINVTFTPVPEPASLAVVGMLGGGLLLRRRLGA